ncbi:hypothetical protein EV363DRAFT_1345315, partial [Boletus edulis]
SRFLYKTRSHSRTTCALQSNSCSTVIVKFRSCRKPRATSVTRIPALSLSKEVALVLVITISSFPSVCIADSEEEGACRGWSPGPGIPPSASACSKYSSKILGACASGCEICRESRSNLKPSGEENLQHPEIELHTDDVLIFSHLHLRHQYPAYPSLGLLQRVAHIGKGEMHKGYRTCDIAFEHFHSSHLGFLLLTKAIIVFMAREHPNAISSLQSQVSFWTYCVSDSLNISDRYPDGNLMLLDILIRQRLCEALYAIGPHNGATLDEKVYKWVSGEFCASSYSFPAHSGFVCRLYPTMSLEPQKRWSHSFGRIPAW